MCHKVTHKNLIDSSPLFPCKKEKIMYKNSYLYNVSGQSKGGN